MAVAVNEQQAGAISCVIYDLLTEGVGLVQAVREAVKRVGWPTDDVDGELLRLQLDRISIECRVRREEERLLAAQDAQDKDAIVRARARVRVARDRLGWL
jgi:hypothetical protein